MGLFIGASILTILELFDYAYEVRHRTHTMLKLPKTHTFSQTHYQTLSQTVMFGGRNNDKKMNNNSYQRPQSNRLHTHFSTDSRPITHTHIHIHI